MTEYFQYYWEIMQELILNRLGRSEDMMSLRKCQTGAVNIMTVCTKSNSNQI